MNLRDDRRGVSTVVGAVLMFAILIVLLSLYQAQVVPAQNEAAEFQHSQEVQTDLLHLRDGLLRTAASGSSYPTSVALGTRYPTRIFFVNPPPASGRLTTESVGPGQITVSNVRALDTETADYWNGDDRTFDSKSLVYEAEYTYLQQSPLITYENSMLYDRYPKRGVTVVDAAPTVVDGNTLTLVTLAGNLSRNGVSTTSVDPRPASAPTHEVTVENTVSPGKDNVVVTLPTQLSAPKWRELLADEFDPDGKDDDADDGYVLAVRGSSGSVDIVLEPDTYALRLAKLGVGTGVEDPGAAYLTDVHGDNSTVQEGLTQKVVGQVRDRFNNPKSGVPVNATASLGTVTPSTTRSNSEGLAAFTYEAPENVDTAQEVDVTVYYGGTDPTAVPASQKVTFDLTVVSSNTSGGPAIRTFDVADTTDTTTSPNKAIYDVTWRVTDDDSDLSEVRLRLVNTNNGKTVDSTTVSVSGQEASGTNTLTDSGGEGKTYRIVITAADAKGNTVSKSQTDTADGTDP